MKIKLSLLLFLLCVKFYAQESLKSKNRFINEFQVFTGVNTVGFYNGFKVSDFYTLIPESQNKSNDLSFNDVVQINPTDFEYNAGFYVNASIAHQLKNSRITWRTGLNYAYANYVLLAEYKKGSAKHDFVYNNLDFVSYQKTEQKIQCDMDIYFTKFAIENSVSYESERKNRLQFYGGVSTQIGRSRTMYRYYYENEIETYKHDSLGVNTKMSSSLDSVNVYRVGRRNPYLSINLLYGYDIILSKKDNFMKNIHLFSEFKPGFCFLYVPELKKIRATYNGFFSFVGLRFYLN